MVTLKLGCCMQIHQFLRLTTWSRGLGTDARLSNSTFQVIQKPDVQDESYHVPLSIPRPPYAMSTVNKHPYSAFKHWMKKTNRNHEIKNRDMISRIRKACRIGRRVLNHVKPIIKAGVSCADINSLAHSLICSHHAYPSPLGYKGFPHSVCTSVNNVVVHGIPDRRKLIDGDIINVDISLYIDGVHGDLSETFLVGDVDKEGVRLVDVTKRCLNNAINACAPGTQFNAIGHVISRLAHAHGFTVCPYFVGHGIGEEFHETPQVLHHHNTFGGIMKTGMTFTIEPVLCEGSSQIEHWSDGWTVVTADGKRAAQFEHTVLITNEGVDVLTKDDPNDHFVTPSLGSKEMALQLLKKYVT